MATTTTNYGLTKPAYDDIADVGVVNSNMDIIDEKLKENSDAAAGLQDSIGTINNSIIDLNENKANSNHTHTKSDIGLGNVDNTADSEKSVNYASSANYANSAGSATNATNATNASNASNASNAGATTINGTWKKVEYGNGHGYIIGNSAVTLNVTSAYGSQYLASGTVTIPAACRKNATCLSAIASVLCNYAAMYACIKSVDLNTGAIGFYVQNAESKANCGMYIQFMFEF